MPIFEYRCADCGREFEELVLSSEDKVGCPACGGSRTEKQISTFASPTGNKPAGDCAGCSSFTGGG